VREYDGAPDLSSLKLRAGFLDKTLAEIDLMLQQHRKPWPDHATWCVSLRWQASGPAAHVVQNTYTLLAAAGQAAIRRKRTVQLHEAQCWSQSSTDKGQLAAALQTRLEQVGAGFLSSDKDTLRRLVFTRFVQVFWHVTPQLQKSFASDYSKAGPAVKATVIEFQDLCGYRQLQQGEHALLESMNTDLDDASKAYHAEPSMLKCASSWIVCVPSLQASCQQLLQAVAVGSRLCCGFPVFETHIRGCYRVLTSPEWSAVSHTLHGLHKLLQCNDHRLTDQQERTARSRSGDAALVPPGSYAVPAAPCGAVPARFAAMHDALDAADDDSTSPAAIVHIQRAWLTNPHAALETQRQQFKTAMVALEAGNVRTIIS
jgi:hypothetical protein